MSILKFFSSGVRLIENLICEGGNKGNEILAIVNETANIFFTLPLSSIEAACNVRRQKYLSEWQQKNPRENILDMEVSIYTYETGISEILLAFKLSSPDKIFINIFDSHYSDVPEVPAFVYPKDPNIKTKYLNIYLPHFIKYNIKYYCNSINMLLEDILIHEFLHCCGEITHDGTIRYNFIGINAIKPLMYPH